MKVCQETGSKVNIGFRHALKRLYPGMHPLKAAF